MTNRYGVEVIDGTYVHDDVVAPMEPSFATEPHLAEIAEELRSREPLFHREGAGVSHEDRVRGTAPDFWEVGASGRRYGRAYCLEALEKRYREPTRALWHIEDFQVREIAERTYLVTYTMFEPEPEPEPRLERVTRRSTLWRKSDAGDWVILYHQGTLVL